MIPYQQLLDASQDGMLAFDRELRFVSWNLAMERIAGLCEAEVLGRRAFEVFPRLVDTPHERKLERTLEGEASAVRDASFAAPDNEGSGTCDTRYYPWRDDSGRVIGGIAVVRDARAAELAEQSIRETEGRFRNMADVAPILLWMSDTDGLCTFFNQTWLSFTGRTFEDECGVGWAEGVHFEDFQRCIDTYMEAFNTRSVFAMEYRLLRHDGQFRWILDRGTPRYLPDGSFAGFIGSCADITEHRELEARLRQAIAVRDDFMSIASHELRTPLGALRLQADGMMRLLEQDTPAPPERSRRAWHMVQGSINRLQQLTSSLLDVSRLGSGRPSLHVETLDVAAVVRDVCERFREQIDAAGCTLVLHAAARLDLICDRQSLDQIVSNLLGNAVKYGRGKPIEVTVAGDTHTVRLTVRDHGIGIAAKDHARIFRRFERAVPSTSYGGLGLGLWIVKQLLDSLGGEISVVSAPGEGATFAVLLSQGA